MLLTRRALVAALALAALPRLALAGQEEVLRVSGAVTPGNYKGLETFLSNSVDSVVGLKLQFEEKGDAADGEVNANVEDGLFTGYLVGDGESEITARGGFVLSQSAYVFDGFFVVKNGGFNQGVTSYFLAPADEATVLLSSATITDIDVDRLDPAIGK